MTHLWHLLCVLAWGLLLIALIYRLTGTETPIDAANKRRKR